MLSFHLRLGLPRGLLPSGLPPKTLYCYCYEMQKIIKLLIMLILISLEEKSIIKEMILSKCSENVAGTYIVLRFILFFLKLRI